MSSIPLLKIDNRDFNDVLKELREHVPFYAPEWNASNENDVGVALAKIFSHMMIYMIDRLNKVPQRNYIEFLNMLGVKLSPGQPSTANVSFLLSQGVKHDVIVREGTKLSAPANEKHGELTFQTAENVLLTRAKLVEVWSVSGRNGRDGIYRHTEDYLNQQPFSIFFGDNLQRHILYLGDQDVFNIKNDSVIIIEFSCNDPEAFLKVLNKAYWEYNWKLDSNTGQEVSSKFYAETVASELIAGSMPRIRTKLFLTKHGLVEFSKYVINTNDKLTLILNLPVDHPDSSPSVILNSTSDPQGITVHLIQTAQTFENVQYQAMNVKLTSMENSSSISGQEKLRVAEGDIVTAIYADNLTVASVNSKGKSEIETSEVQNTKSKWVSCSLSAMNFVSLQKTIEERFKIYDIDIWSESKAETYKADMLFFNNIPLEDSDSSGKPIYPFGQKPIILDTFYIACQSVLTRRDATITISFQYVDTRSLLIRADNNLVLSWEYWNGKSWVTLKIDKTDTKVSELIQSIQFQCPNKIEETEVNGVKNYWIRTRIVLGDYGKEKLKPDGANPPNYTIDTFDILYPKIFNLNLSFELDSKKPQHCTIYNNQEYSKNIIQNNGSVKPFTPFVGLADTSPTVYLGFDRKVESGPINLYLSLSELDRSEEKNVKPSINYSYSSGGTWKNLDVIDDTKDLAKSGYVKFLFPTDFEPTSIFGKDRYWIQVVDRSAKFASAIDLGKRCPDDGADSASGTIRTLPYIKGLHLNTIPSINISKVEEEVLGTSNGQPDQIFKFSKRPVVNLDRFKSQVWINESRFINELELEALKNRGEIRQVTDLTGSINEIWVLWHQVHDIYRSGPSDRHYELDHAFGLAKFGARIPPLLRDNIKASYFAGGGSAGNVIKGEINSLKTPVPFVESGTNLSDMGGVGIDTETVEQALVRGPQKLKHRGQAVTPEDFEWLIREKFPSIAKVKCNPNSRIGGEFESGHVAIVIVPDSSEEKPSPSLTLIQEVERYLGRLSSNVLVSANRLRVVSPVFIKISVIAKVYVKSIDFFSSIEKTTKERLKSFLHPLLGGFEGKGWKFGSLVCISDIYSCLQRIEGIDHIENISIELEIESSGGAEIQECKKSHRISSNEMSEIMKMSLLPVLNHSLIYSGEHKIETALELGEEDPN